MQTATSRQNDSKPVFRPRLELLADAYYSISDISNQESPYYVASPATIFRALRDKKLRASRGAGRKTLVKGSAIHEWLKGGE
jgi:hypothetical protein